MTIEEIAGKVERKLLVKELTAGEIAARVSTKTFTISGRGLARPLAYLTRQGRAIKIPGRRPRYSKVATV